MLIVASTLDGIPYDMVPKVSPEELSERGRFELVSVLFALEGRPVEGVATEVAAFVGKHARVTPLPATGQLLVIDTAGRVDAIRKLISTIPIPKSAPAQPPAPKPKPVPPVLKGPFFEGAGPGRCD